MGNRRPRAEASVSVLPNAIPTRAATKAILDTYDISRPLKLTIQMDDSKRRLGSSWTLTRFAVARQDAWIQRGLILRELGWSAVDMAARYWRGLAVLSGPGAENRHSMRRLPRFIPFGKLSPIS
jgi:hypothetical protein